MTLLVPKNNNKPFALFVIDYITKNQKVKFKKTSSETEDLSFTDEKDEKINGDLEIAKNLCIKYSLSLYPEGKREEIDLFLNMFPTYQTSSLEEYLTFRTFIVGYEFTLADLAVWFSIRLNRGLPTRCSRFVVSIGDLDVIKYFSGVSRNYLTSLSGVKSGKNEGAKPKKKVVTRFAPEPSGYLHIGHAKALLFSEQYSLQHGGELILRFDNTNPKNETEEFEKLIQEDVGLLDVKYHRVEHTSDYIPRIIDCLVDFIKRGLAFVDDTPGDEISKQRLALQPSKNRDLSVEENLRLWDEMMKRTEHGLKCVVRAKIDYKNVNGVLRDPVIARHIENGYHPKTGTKYPVYPVYDFACPIVDSDSGVTHAMRSWEYADRDHLYKWFVKQLNLRDIEIVSFSRLSFNYTELSKRHLRRLVAEGKAEGWDDPRFPTIRGLRRRGLQPKALKEFCGTQGGSRNQNCHDWDKIWAMNKDIVQPKTPRVMNVNAEEFVELFVEGVHEGEIEVEVNPANKQLGTKKLHVGPNLHIEHCDAELLSEGEKVSLFRWNNIKIEKIIKDGSKIVKIESKWVGDSDFKSTRKINWIVPSKAVKIEMREYNHLLKEKDFNAENNDILDAINPVPYVSTYIHADPYFKSFKKGDIFQLDRRAEVIIDKLDGDIPVTFLIPTGTARCLGIPIKVQLFSGTQPGKN